MLVQFLRKYLYFAFLCTFAFSAVPASFIDNFDESGLPEIIETGKMRDSLDLNWWLNSGAYIYRVGGVATTVQGKLADTDRFRLLYAKSNPVDTDSGYQPQNLIRFVTRIRFKSFTQEVFFNIDQINISKSPNRNQSNGVLLFHRYQDGDNLYYAGIRVDGSALIKKKLNGQYYLLKTVPVYPGVYNRETTSNLLPIKRWIGIRTEIRNKSNGNVEIAMYLNDIQLGSGWTKVLQVEDTGSDAERILTEGYAGIRSDFMDVSFDNYKATEDHN